MPGKGTHVPLYILGSSLFGAKLAARLGLQYAFASHFAAVQRWRVRVLLGRGVGGEGWSDAEAEAVLDSPPGQTVKAMSTYTAVGTASEVRSYVDRFATTFGADELIVVFPGPTLDERLRSMELLAGA